MGRKRFKLQQCYGFRPITLLSVDIVENMPPRRRDVRKFTQSGHSIFESFESFDEAPLSKGLTSIKTNNRWFDFVYEDRGAKVTLVTFSAATPAKVETYPSFAGHPMSLELDVNWLAFSDPATGSAESLLTFWHLGTRRVDSQRFIPAIVRKAAAQGSGESLLFFGSSAGGFAALNYGSQFPGSAALVMNPRVNILNYPNRFDNYSATAFPGFDEARLTQTLPLDMAAHYESPRGNTVFYVQNLQDSVYVKHHHAHFERSVVGRPDVQFITGDWGVGHVVPPREAYMGPLAALVASAPAWEFDS